jgi:hypothetical protein
MVEAAPRALDRDIEAGIHCGSGGSDAQDACYRHACLLVVGPMLLSAAITPTRELSAEKQETVERNPRAEENSDFASMDQQ